MPLPRLSALPYCTFNNVQWTLLYTEIHAILHLEQCSMNIAIHRNPCHTVPWTLSYKEIHAILHLADLLSNKPHQTFDLLILNTLHYLVGLTVLDQIRCSSCAKDSNCCSNVLCLCSEKQRNKVSFGAPSPPTGARLQNELASCKPNKNRPPLP